MKKKKTFLSAHPPQTRETLQDIGKHYSNILTALVLLLLCVILSLIVLAVKLSSHTYILTDGNRYETVRLHPGTIAEAQKISNFQNLKVIAQRREGNTTYLTLDQELSAQIKTKDQTMTVPFTACTVGELLEQVGIAVGENDIVVPGLDRWLVENTEISITEVSYRSEVETITTPFQVETRQNSDMVDGTQHILQYGRNGETEITYRITLHDGVPFEKEMVFEEEVLAPVNCIIEQGTKKRSTVEPAEPVQQDGYDTADAGSTAADSASGSQLSTAGRSQVWSVPAGIQDDTASKTITAADGSTFQYSSVIDVTATAYHRIEDGGLITASGTTTRYGTIAVDPRVIPLGSRVYVVSDGGDQSWSYGPGIAEDTGGLIKDNRIDLFFMTDEEADQFGVRPAKVYILS